MAILSPGRARQAARFAFLIVIVFFLVSNGGCAPEAPQPPPPTLVVTETPGTGASPAAAGTALATPAVFAATTPSTMTLTWWTPEFLSPSAPQPAGPELARQLEAFSAASGGRVRVDPVLKARYGKGGLLDYLITAQQVAPGVLPDIVTLDVAELPVAAVSGVLQPLDDLLSEELTVGLYPFARGNGLFEGRLLAVQWLADFEHVASRPEQVPTPPAQWSLLLADRTTYLFALAMPQAGSAQTATGGLSDAALSHYLSAGAQINPDDRSLSLSATPLARLLEYYQSADQAGLLPPSSLQLADGDAVWSVFAQGQVPMALVSARRYAAEAKDTGAPAFSDGPGWNQPAPPIASGWALAIVTQDPARQQAAASLIAWLLQTEHTAALSSTTGWFPTSPAALQTQQATPYLEFADRQLAAAVALPASADYPQVAASIQAAIVAVIEENQPVGEAVEAALDSQK